MVSSMELSPPRFGLLVETVKGTGGTDRVLRSSTCGGIHLGAK